MRKLKRFLSLLLVAVMMISMSGMSVMAAEQQEVKEGYIEIFLMMQQVLIQQIIIQRGLLY
ncbi:MAG: hypothetical protein K2N34_15745 [Lachnospiraceae bacterium]|nr:hypothetical protein [Lachnospiraceae bacterium]